MDEQNEPASGPANGRPDDTDIPVDAGFQLEPVEPRWKEVARRYVPHTVTALVTAIAATVVTLAATQKTAVTENLSAYLNGMKDGYGAGFEDGQDGGVNLFDDDDWHDDQQDEP